MNCTHHIQNKLLMVCMAPHKCEFERKLCIECLYEHEVEKKDIVPFNTFQKKVEKKLKELQIELATLKMNLNSMTTLLKKIQDEFEESLKQLYDIVELREEFYLKILNNNQIPTYLSNTNLEKLVQVLMGNNIDEWINQKNYYLKKLDNKKAILEEQAKTFCENIKKEMEEIIYGITLGYERKEDLYEVLARTKYIDEQFLQVVLGMFRKEQNMNILSFLLNFWKNTNQDQLSLKVVTNVLKNISEIDFNTKNYSTEKYEQIRANLIQQISNDQHIIKFLKFLVYLTVFDSNFIQCGSNSLNLLVEMKVDLKGQNFENIRIRDTSLIGGNFVRCNFNGSEFDNVDIGGINLSQACLFNCKWKNIKIIELNKLDSDLDLVKSPCFSSDGTTLVSGSDDKSTRLWDVKTGSQKAKLDGHSDRVNIICYSPNGTTLASGSDDNSIRLWDVMTGSQKAKLEGHSDRVNTICYSPNGTTLASGGHDNSIRLWDVETGQQKAKLDGHSDTVYSICYSPDGTTLASGSYDNSIRLWDVKTGQQKVKLDGHSNYVMSVNFSPDGTTLASGSDDNSIRLWDVKKGQQKAKLDGHLDSVRTICYSPDGTTLASGSEDNSIRLWDVKTGQQKAKLDGHSHYVMSVNFSPDGATLVSASQDNTIRLWDVKIGQQIILQDNSYKDILAQFKPSTFVTSYITILKTSQNLNLEAQGTLILKGELLDYQGNDLRSLFRSKGSLILENELKQKQN